MAKEILVLRSADNCIRVALCEDGVNRTAVDLSFPEDGEGEYRIALHRGDLDELIDMLRVMRNAMPPG